MRAPSSVTSAVRLPETPLTVTLTTCLPDSVAPSDGLVNVMVMASVGAGRSTSSPNAKARRTTATITEP